MKKALIVLAILSCLLTALLLHTHEEPVQSGIALVTIAPEVFPGRTAEPPYDWDRVQKYLQPERIM